MAKGIELVTAVLFLLGTLGIVFERYFKMRKRYKEMPVAYFTGGPLNGETRKLEDIGPRYVYMYKRAALNQGGQNSPMSIPQWNVKVAIYNHQGDGIYSYQGSVDEDDNQLDYEIDEVETNVHQ